MYLHMIVCMYICTICMYCMHVCVCLQYIPIKQCELYGSSGFAFYLPKRLIVVQGAAMPQPRPLLLPCSGTHLPVRGSVSASSCWGLPINRWKWICVRNMRCHLHAQQQRQQQKQQQWVPLTSPDQRQLGNYLRKGSKPKQKASPAFVCAALPRCLVAPFSPLSQTVRPCLMRAFLSLSLILIHSSRSLPVLAFVLPLVCSAA